MILSKRRAKNEHQQHATSGPFLNHGWKSAHAGRHFAATGEEWAISSGGISIPNFKAVVPQPSFGDLAVAGTQVMVHLSIAV